MVLKLKIREKMVEEKRLMVVGDESFTVAKGGGVETLEREKEKKTERVWRERREETAYFYVIKMNNSVSNIFIFLKYHNIF